MSEITEKYKVKTGELDNLLKLIDDEDENIYGSIKERFLFHGDLSSEFLKKYINSDNPVIKRRSSEIISVINFEKTEKKFAELILKDKSDILEEALLLIAQMGYPEIEPENYFKITEDMSAEIKSRISADNGNTALEILNTINEYLFFEKRFSGNEENYYDPDNSYLNKVIDNKKGIPVTLSALYLIITRRLNLPVYGISIPGHFILKYSSDDEEFFIDPYNKGIIISMSEAKKFIKNIGMSEEEFKEIPYLRNASDKDIVLRVMRNLADIYRKDGDKLRAEQFELIMEYFI